VYFSFSSVHIHLLVKLFSLSSYNVQAVCLSVFHPLWCLLCCKDVAPDPAVGLPSIGHDDMTPPTPKTTVQERPADATAPSFLDYRTGNSATRSAAPEKPCLERNMQWIGCTVFEIFTFKLCCDFETVVRGH